MPTNEILPFATSVGANVQSQADYNGSATRPTGFQPGIATSASLNKVWRQSSFMAAGLASFIVANGGTDVLDNGDLTGLTANLTSVIAQMIQDQTGNYAVDTGAANVYVIAPNPPIGSYTDGLTLRFLAANTNTGPATVNANGLGAKSIVRSDGSVLQRGDIPAQGVANILYSLSVDKFFLISTTSSAFAVPLQNSLYTSFDDTGAANAYVITPVPAIVAYGKSQRFQFTAANANTGASTLNINGMGAKSITRRDLSSLQANDITAGSLCDVMYDGTRFQLMNAAARPLQYGQGRLYLSGANLVFAPLNGNNLVVNGVPYTIPAAGVSLAPAGTVAGTLYYIYAFMSGSTMTLEASATGHSTDASTGVEIKTGDPTRTLVGMARPVAGPAWVDSATQRFVAGWFNRRVATSVNALASDTATTSNTLVELSTAARAEFLTWGDNDSLVSATGVAKCSIANGNVMGGVLIDGVAASGLVITANAGGIANTTQANISTPVVGKRLSEGYHYVSVAGATNTGSTGTFFGSYTGAQSSVMQ